jgi:hypothetical protein
MIYGDFFYFYRVNALDCEEYMAQHMRGDAGVPDGIMNSAACTRSQTLRRI